MSLIYKLKKTRESVTAFFSPSLYMFFGRIIELVYLFLSSYREREEKKRNSQNNTTDIAVVFVIMLVSNKKQRGRIKNWFLENNYSV